MTRRYLLLFKCDRCNAEGSMPPEGEAFHDRHVMKPAAAHTMPPGWRNLAGRDVCRQCAEDYAAWWSADAEQA